MKLMNVQTYPIENVPDHITHECTQLGISLVVEVQSLFQGKDPNIILGAIAFFHSAMIKELISDKIEEQQKCAKMAALALIKNVDFLNSIKD